jgi:hypothetical protein
MDRQTTLRVLVVGNAAHGDFADALAEVRRTARVWFVPNGEYAAAWLEANPPVDWIVLVQARPHELPREVVDRLQARAAEARFVSLLGTWCEGELRTGRRWADVPRLYWYEFPSWWRLSALATGRTNDGQRPAQVGTVVVSTIDFASADTLLAVLLNEGFSGIWWPQNRAAPTFAGVTAGVWVGGQLGGAEAAQLATFCDRVRADRAAVIALLDFPRRDRVAIAKRIGATQVLGKPWQIADLAQALRRTVNHSIAVKNPRTLAIRSA